MSSTYSDKIRYICSNECNRFGCPGHTLQIKWHGTSDTVIILVDDEPTDYFDENRFIALLKAAEK